MTATALKLCTAEEYLAMEVKSETCNEYRDRKIVPMLGGTSARSFLSEACTSY